MHGRRGSRLSGIALAAFAAAALVGGHSAEAADSQAASTRAGAVERITMFSASFWGMGQFTEWQIDSRGNGLFRSVERLSRSRFGVVTRRFSAGRGGFRRIEGLLRSAELFSGAELPCSSELWSDSARGEISWTRGGVARRLQFDQGCDDAFSRNMFGQWERAEALVARWAAGGEIRHVREFRRGGPPPAPAPFG